MKKLILLFILFLGITAFSQQKIVESGIYKSTPENKYIFINISPDQTYKIFYILSEGKMENEKDSIVFNESLQDESNFKIKSIEKNTSINGLKLNFKTNYLTTYTTEILIGTQLEEQSTIKYHKLSELYPLEDTAYDTYPNEFSINIEKTKYLYLIESDSEGNTNIVQFEIPENINEIEVTYIQNSLNALKLKGYFHPNSKELIVSDGISPLIFKLENTIISSNSDVIAPIIINKEKNWFQKNGITSDFEDKHSNMEVDSVVEAYSPYDFKYKIENNFNDALKSTAKSPSKFLVVIYDELENAQSNFNELIKKFESETSYNMYSEYNPDYDFYNFYFASKKDKDLLKKNNINSQQEVLFFNSDGLLLNHFNGNLQDKNNFLDFYGYNTESIYKGLQKADTSHLLDNIFKLNNSDLKIAESLLKIAKLDIDFIAKEKDDFSSIDTSLTAVEEAEATDENETYFRNLYQLQTSFEKLTQSWEGILKNYTTAKKYDSIVVALALNELNKTGFTQKFKTDNSKLVNETDFKILDYILQVYPDILNFEKQKVNTDAYDYSDLKVEHVLNNLFYNNSQYEYQIQNLDYSKIYDYYKKYVDLNKDNYNAIIAFLNTFNILDNEKIKNDYFYYFDNFFDSNISPSINPIESLDNLYKKLTINTQETYPLDWTNFKFSISNLANSAAWNMLVTNNLEYLQKALKWSEFALKIDENHYYLDTLARVYYLNGDKEKAIKTQEKAIELGALSEENEYQEEYKKALDLMKKGIFKQN